MSGLVLGKESALLPAAPSHLAPPLAAQMAPPLPTQRAALGREALAAGLGMCFLRAPAAGRAGGTSGSRLQEKEGLQSSP